jgi:SSS family solute:Na+ symporter
MKTIDWFLFVLLILAFVAIGYYSRRFVKGVADFLIVSRKMRKYLGLSTGSAEGLGLISIAVIGEQGFKHGFSYAWMAILSMVILIPMFGLLGFGIKRFRATEVQTIPQYHQMRYSKGVRICVGFALALGGILNMAIFPVVSANFLAIFLGLPEHLQIFGATVTTNHLIMMILIFISFVLASVGGMVSVIVTDYIQSVILAGSIFIITLLVVKKATFGGIHQGLQTNYGPAAYNPFLAGGYGFTWVLFFVLSCVLAPLTFPPSVSKGLATDSPETFRKMYLLSNIFGFGRTMSIVVWGVGAMVVLGIAVPAAMDPNYYTRYATAFFIRDVVPTGLMGICAAGLLFAYVATSNGYVLSWAAIIVNDVISPLKKEPFSPHTHLFALKVTIAIISGFLLWWGVFYELKESILSYLFLTGSIFTAAGIISLCGLYWKRANTLGAYCTVAVCILIPMADLLGKQWLGSKYPLKEHESGLVALVLSFLLFFITGMLSKKGLKKWVDYGEKLKKKVSNHVEGAEI